MLIYLVVLVADPKTILFHFPFHTGELLSMSSGAHGRDAPTESRHSVEEQSAPAVKRKCTRDEEQSTPAVKRKCTRDEEQSTPAVKRKCTRDEDTTTLG